MSWLSQAWRKLTNTPKVPQLLDYKRIDTRRAQLVGDKIILEIVARLDGGYGVVFKRLDGTKTVHEFDGQGNAKVPPVAPSSPPLE